MSFEKVSFFKLIHSAIEVFEKIIKNNNILIRILDFNVFYTFVVF